ncbi:MAG: hypothetical protein AAF492_16210, partial [Verrucomicrobiota bacterium]
MPAWSEVWYRDIYPHTDLRFYSKGDGTIEYDFILKPGADLDAIRLRLDGIDTFDIDENGELVLQTPIGEMRKGAPYTYQVIDGRECEIESAYRVTDDGRLTFEVAAYDAEHPLIIDPTTLLAGTFFPGDGAKSYVQSVDVDDAGVHIVGAMSLPLINTTPGVFNPSFSGGGARDAFAATLSHDLTSLFMFTYLSDNLSATANDSWIHATHVKSVGGDLYIAGGQIKSGGAVRTTGGAFQQFNPRPGACDIFITVGNNRDRFLVPFVQKISRDGTTLKYGTYLSGTDAATFEEIEGLEVHNGLIYVAGITTSTDFPTTSNAFSTVWSGSGSAGFLSIIDPTKTNGEDLVYSTYIHGEDQPGGNTTAKDLKIDPATGDIWIVGGTDEIDFPTSPHAVNRLDNLQGRTDGILLRFGPLASLGNGAADLQYSTGIGTPGAGEEAQSLALAGGGEVYVGLFTVPPLDSFPVVGDPYRGVSNSGINDGYIALVDTVGGQLTASTYIGSANNPFIIRFTVTDM